MAGTTPGGGSGSVPGAGSPTCPGEHPGGCACLHARICVPAGLGRGDRGTAASGGPGAGASAVGLSMFRRLLSRLGRAKAGRAAGLGVSAGDLSSSEQWDPLPASLPLAPAGRLSPVGLHPPGARCFCSGPLTWKPGLEPVCPQALTALCSGVRGRLEQGDCRGGILRVSREHMPGLGSALRLRSTCRAWRLWGMGRRPRRVDARLMQDAACPAPAWARHTWVLPVPPEQPWCEPMAPRPWASSTGWGGHLPTRVTGRVLAPKI